VLLVSDIHFGHNEPEDIESLLEVARDTNRTGDQGLVIMCGDFTSSGRTHEFKQAAELVRKIIDAGNTVVLTPGNHDFGIPGIGTDHGNWIPGLSKVGRKRFQQHLMSLVLAQPEVVAHNDFDTITQHGDDVFVALRSTHRAGSKRYLALKGISRIKKKQIAWAREQLDKLEYERAWFVTHRSIWGDAKHSAMSRKGRLEEQLFKQVAFDGFIHGHNHNVVFDKTTTPKLEIPMLHVAVPTLSTRGGKQNRAFLVWDGKSEPELIANERRAGPFHRQVVELGRTVARERGVVHGVLSAVFGAVGYGAEKVLEKVDEARGKGEDDPERPR
jgi:UDP-2,3-diacylglucosamine pyrophosphatase LpxH